MKKLIAFFLFSHSISITYDLTIYNLSKYDTIKTNLESAGLCFNLKTIEDDNNFYINFYSINGSLNETLKYEYLNNTSHKNYTFDPENNSLNSKGKTSSTSYNEEFSYEYEFLKKPNLNFLFVVYTEYYGTELSITFSGVKKTTVLLVFLGIFGGFIIVLLVFCFLCYRICKKRNSKVFPSGSYSSFGGEEYNPIVSE